MKNINIDNFSKLREMSTDFSMHGDDFMCAHLIGGTDHQSVDIDQMHRFDGYVSFLCLEGKLEFEVNLDKFEAGPDTMVFILPQSLFRITPRQTPCDLYVITISSEFARDINIDINVMNTDLITHQERAMRLTPDQRNLLLSYLRLFSHNASNPNRHSQHIARNLVAAAAYQLNVIRESHASEAAKEAPQTRSRRSAYVQDFLRLVREHHCQERSLSFYADKLFISAKYLSIIVKEATDITASEWIDRYVLQEAKNLLRFSGKNIQQVAYELNFPTQSSFGKFFKNQTGMSPSAFLNA